MPTEKGLLQVEKVNGTTNKIKHERYEFQKKKIILTIFPLLVFFIYSWKNQSKIVSLDAKYTCSCLKKVSKKARRLEKKVERREKKTYKHGGKNERIFGGSNIRIDFDLDECRNGKRNKMVKDYIDSLGEDGKSRFDRKVLITAKRKCPDSYKRVLG